MGITRDVSRQLDAFSQVPGAVLVRDGTGWKALAPSSPGLVLGLNDDGEPEWITNPGGIVTDTGWVDLTYLNDWYNDRTDYRDLAYRQLASGIICISGLARHDDATPPAVVATLPVGYRPGTKRRWSARNGPGVCELEIEENGDIEMNRSTNGFLVINHQFVPDDL